MTGIQDSTTNHLGSLIRGGGKFIIPKFQRDYSWDVEQWDDLWQDIENMMAEETDHYMGYLVLQSKERNESLIIDGQQRFTTITIIILAAIKAIQKLIDKGIEVDDNRKRIETLKATYIGNMDPVSLEYDNILVLNRNNNAYYKDYIVKLEDLRLRNISYTEKLMKKCFEWYEKKLDGKYSSGKDYAHFITYIVDNLYFTIIRVSDEMNAFRVFETLNARGVQLSSSDLVKNYLFSLVDNTSLHSGRLDTLEEKWASLTKNIKAEKLPDFIRYYWNSKNKTVRTSELFKTIRSAVKTDRQVFELLSEMLSYSDVYMALMDPTDDLWQNQKEAREGLELLKIFNLKQPLSLLMAAYMNLSEVTFLQVLKDAIIVSFRYSVICGKNPNEVERVYNDIARNISEKKTYSRELLRKIYVEDNEFIQAFNVKSFSDSSRNNKVVKFILNKIERFKGGLRDSEIYSETDTIEHIYPQSPGKDWTDDDLDSLTYRLGNLCLLEKKLNQEIENNPYSVKKEIFLKSSFETTKSIPESYPDWNRSAIINRQSSMGKAARSIWKIDF